MTIAENNTIGKNEEVKISIKNCFIILDFFFVQYQTTVVNNSMCCITHFSSLVFLVDREEVAFHGSKDLRGGHLEGTYM